MNEATTQSRAPDNPQEFWLPLALEYAALPELLRAGVRILDMFTARRHDLGKRIRDRGFALSLLFLVALPPLYCMLFIALDASSPFILGPLLAAWLVGAWSLVRVRRGMRRGRDLVRACNGFVLLLGYFVISGGGWTAPSLPFLSAAALMAAGYLPLNLARRFLVIIAVLGLCGALIGAGIVPAVSVIPAHAKFPMLGIALAVASTVGILLILISDAATRSQQLQAHLEQLMNHRTGYMSDEALPFIARISRHGKWPLLTIHLKDAAHRTDHTAIARRLLENWQHPNTLLFIRSDAELCLLQFDRNPSGTRALATLLTSSLRSAGVSASVEVSSLAESTTSAHRLGAN